MLNFTLLIFVLDQLLVSDLVTGERLLVDEVDLVTNEQFTDLRKKWTEFRETYSVPRIEVEIDNAQRTVESYKVTGLEAQPQQQQPIKVLETNGMELVFQELDGVEVAELTKSKALPEFSSQIKPNTRYYACFLPSSTSSTTATAHPDSITSAATNGAAKGTGGQNLQSLALLGFCNYRLHHAAVEGGKSSSEKKLYFTIENIWTNRHLASFGAAGLDTRQVKKLLVQELLPRLETEAYFQSQVARVKRKVIVLMGSGEQVKLESNIAGVMVQVRKESELLAVVNEVLARSGRKLKDGIESRHYLDFDLEKIEEQELQLSEEDDEEGEE